MSEPTTRLAEVVRSGLCLGCGLCESIGGTRLPMALNAEGYLRPAGADRVDRETEAEILAVCPGLNQRGPDLPRRDAVWGAFKSIHLGHATDFDLRWRASSAGVVTAAAAHLLATGQADAVLHVGADPGQPFRSTARVSRKPQEVVEGMGARYSPAAPMQRLHALLAQGARIVIVGKPCDVAAARNIARRDPRAARQIVAAISFLCAGLPGHLVSRNIIGRHGVEEEGVALMRYRGHGCPGPTRIETKDGRAFEQGYVETWSSDLTRGVQFRCKICPDSIGEQADLVCCDAWEGGEGYPLGDGEGHSGIIARTALGAALLDELRAGGVVAIEPLSLKRLADMQPHQVRRKTQILTRLAGMALSGQRLPRYRRLGLARSALRGLARAAENLRGTMRRVREGRNREHLPPVPETAVPERTEA